MCWTIRSVAYMQSTSVIIFLQLFNSNKELDVIHCAEITWCKQCNFTIFFILKFKQWMNNIVEFDFTIVNAVYLFPSMHDTFIWQEKTISIWNFGWKLFYWVHHHSYRQNMRTSVSKANCILALSVCTFALKAAINTCLGSCVCWCRWFFYFVNLSEKFPFTFHCLIVASQLIKL